MDEFTESLNITNSCGLDNNTEMEKVVAVVVPIFFGIIGITGLVGNALVILVVLSNPQMRSNTNIMIINLALADLLFVIFCVPFTATDYVTPIWPFGNLWCKIVQYLIVVMVHASIYTLVLMSFDRFLAVVYPIASRSLRTERNTLKAITILWFVIVTSALPVPFVHDVVVNQPYIFHHFAITIKNASRISSTEINIKIYVLYRVKRNPFTIDFNEKSKTKRSEKSNKTYT